MIGGLRKKPEVRRYLLRLAIAMAIYIGSLFAAEILIEDGGLSGPPAYALAALPGLAFAAVPWIFTRLIIEERDEFQRLLYVRQVMVAPGVAPGGAGGPGIRRRVHIAPAARAARIPPADTLSGL